MSKLPVVAAAAAIAAALFAIESGFPFPEKDSVPLVDAVVVGKREAEAGPRRVRGEWVPVPSTLKLLVRPDDGGPEFETSVDPDRYAAAAPGDRVRVFRPTVPLE